MELAGKQVHCGIAQGCPLSPALAGAVMAVWSAVTLGGAETAVSTVSFVDDRLLWAADPVSLLAAKRRSSDFDRAYGFSCDRLKSRFVHRRPPAEVAELAEVLDYEVADSLSLLGVVCAVGQEAADPTLRTFNLQKALRRLRLIGVAARGLLAKKAPAQCFGRADADVGWRLCHCPRRDARGTCLQFPRSAVEGPGC